MKLNFIYAVIYFAAIVLYTSCVPDDLPCDGKANDVFFDITDTDSSFIPLFNKQQLKYLRTNKTNGVKDTVILNKSLQRKKVQPYVVSTDDICPTQYWETTYEFIFKSVNKHMEMYYIFTNHQRRFEFGDFVNETDLMLSVTNENPNSMQLYEARNNGIDEVRKIDNITVLGKVYNNVIQHYWGYGTNIYATGYCMVRYQGRYTTLELVP